MAARKISAPDQLTASGRIMTVGPCPTILKLVSLAEEREGVRLAIEYPIRTFAAGKIEAPKQDYDRTLAVMYVPPTIKAERIEDRFNYTITRPGQTTATAAVTVRVFRSLAAGCSKD